MRKIQYTDLQKKPINKEKYVRDKLRYGSKVKAVQIQKKSMAASNASTLAKKLDQDPVVVRLTEGIEEKIIELNAKRLLKINSHMDSDDEGISLAAAKEAGNAVEKYYDRTIGKAKQSVEVKTTKLTINLDMSGQATAKTAEVIDAEEEIKELAEGVEFN